MLSLNKAYYVTLALHSIAAIILLLVALSGASRSSLWISEVHLLDSTKTRWSLYRMCDLSTVYYNKIQCSKGRAAYPYSPWDSLGDSVAIPPLFESRRSFFATGSQTAFWLLLVGLIGTVITVALHAMKFHRRLVLASAIVAPLGWVFLLVGAALATAVHSKGVAIFRDANYRASLGGCMFALLWAAVALELLAVMMSMYHQYLSMFCTPPGFFENYNYSVDPEKQLLSSLNNLERSPSYSSNKYWSR